MEIKLKSDSRKINKGDTFIAIKNIARDGHDFIQNAIENGAERIIAERGNYSVPTLIVKDTSLYFKNYLYDNYYPYFKDIKLIGVTGTNGKTTTCYLVYQLLNMLNKKAAYIGTLGFFMNGEVMNLDNTTPDIDLLYSLFIKAKENNVEYIVMEVSSIALSRDRIFGLEYDEVAFTNLTQDHLDYHKTMENYIDAKRLLFNKTRGNKIAVINSDDEYYKKFMFDENNNITFGENGKAKISDIVLSNQGTTFKLTYNNKEYNISNDFVGKFNVYNYVMAILLVSNLGVDLEKLIKISSKLKHPPGRMDMIKYKTNSIFIDYAHTPDAVYNAISSTLEYKSGKVITIVGCGGDRDKTKRPIMGEIATRLSDYVILTNDNPRCENEKDIMNDIVSGITKDNYEIIYSRHDAIKKGIELLTDKDILLILGKGHEDYQIIGKEKIHFSDKECALDIIKSLN